jgi:hypothetical protein|tara:strand:- start:22 stop:1116 length:1095 start_codon:yes stop_codon:yes gene_type:complete
MSRSSNDQYSNPIYQSSYVETFNRSNLNGIAKQVTERVIHINSSIRESQAPPLFKNHTKNDNSTDYNYLDKWSSSNFYVHLPETMNKVVTMSVQGIHIPNTIYPISKINGTNIFQVIHSINNTTHIIEIPSGNYNTQQLVQLINNILSNYSITKLKAGYDNISGKFFFYHTDTDTDTDTDTYDIDFSLPFEERNIKLNLGWMLGFRKKKYTFNSNDYIDKNIIEDIYDTDSSKTEDIIENVWTSSEGIPRGFIAEGLLDISIPKYLFLEIDDFSNNQQSKYINLNTLGSAFTMKNVLTRITMSNTEEQLGFVDITNNIPNEREYFGPVNIKKLHIKLVDEFGRVVDLNNNDMSLLLNFQTLYNL